MGHSVLSLLVPVAVIVMVAFTKRVVFSLLSGIILGAWLVSDSFWNMLKLVYAKLSAVFYSNTPAFALNTNSLYIFAFLVILGILTQVISASGASASFVLKARKLVKSARQSEFVALFAGLVIFIDDYFNALIVGQVSKSLNDAHQSSRERLAYIIDSTSAPVCMLMPISSWGAYIVGVMQNEGIENSFALLLSSITSNYYAWFALVAVFLTILWQINLPAMARYKNIGVQDLSPIQQEGSKAPVSLLLSSVAILISSTCALIFYTGYVHAQSFNPLDILKNTQTSFSLFAGGLISLGITLILAKKYLQARALIPLAIQGFKSMQGAILVLILAWTIGPLIRDDLQTGVYLASLIGHFQSASVWLSMVLFVISGFIAFSTGTSWGAFAIMLPIGTSMSAGLGGDLVLAVAAILSGAVYGDHASPISDTTILSATGAGCSIQSHFLTQLPYATLSALCALVAFITASLSFSKTLGFVVGLTLLTSLFYCFKRFFEYRQLKCAQDSCDVPKR
ncbi:Na+/H+ antiporter NhaC family protein [Helicobacter baculiformis]|uniref:Na+/H+ antiporter NhaC family protein n=1 Tax=Helicobacter baculiformis TaxID=427351 RepID=A0ABV7ZLE7_9HELI|nr:Na+/H+ antiporter NhaC family protein [Helicobacter baculiformis]